MAKTDSVKKVLFLSSWFPNRVTPVNGDFVERHALAVSRICKTAVLHVAPDNNVHDRFLEIFEIQKSELSEVIIYFRPSKIRIRFLAKLINNFFYAAGYFIGYWIVKREMGTPDVIHANIIVPVARMALLLHRFTRIPYVISEHWTVYLSNDRNKIPVGYAKAVEKAFALIPCTLNLKEALIRFGYKSRYFIVPNVVDTTVFRPVHSIAPSHKKMLLHVSSMKDEHKNITGIIRAIGRLRINRDDFTFMFVGEAQPRQRSLVSETGLSDCVIFAGEVEHKKVASFMQQSDIFVMFSHVENLPCVILEALGCGLPVLSTNVGGIPEWIGEENGILVNPGDEDALVDGMNHLVDHCHEYDREQLHKFTIKHFSERVIAAHFLEIYNQAQNSVKR